MEVVALIVKMVESHFSQEDIVIKAAIRPEDAANVKAAVKRQINSLLFKYQEELHGIPLTYSDMRFEPGKQHARIIGEYPWLHVNMIITCLVFKPQPKQMLIGTVHKVTTAYRLLAIMYLLIYYILTVKCLLYHI